MKCVGMGFRPMKKDKEILNKKLAEKESIIENLTAENKKLAEKAAKLETKIKELKNNK